MNITIRVFVDGVLDSEEHLAAVADEELGGVIDSRAAAHADICSRKAAMIEFEFHDAPEHERFFRIGSDPRDMVMPIRIEME